MGGGGGGGYSLDARELQKLRQEAQARFDRAESEAEINGFLAERLVEINERDYDAVDAKLDAVEEILSEKTVGFDRLLFGGSVAKHTYVDGLSDIDSLVILGEGTERDTPTKALREIRSALERNLPRGTVDGIETGFAVTINFRDGTKLQLLPAVQRGQEVAISSPDGSSWVDIHPRGFARALTEVNKAQAGRVVPTIKLAKSVLVGLPADQRLSGYHAEALAVGAFTGYSGPQNLKDMLTHFFTSSAENVRRPIPDVTGQSHHVDEALGPANSQRRRATSAALRRVGRTMEKSVSLREWQALISE